MAHLAKHSNGHSQASHVQRTGFSQGRPGNSDARKTDILSSSTASTEASTSENSSHGCQTPPHPAAAKALQTTHKRTRRSHRRKNGTMEQNCSTPVASKPYWGGDDSTSTHREVVTVSDLLFDLGQSPSKASSIPISQTVGGECVVAPPSPCRTRSGPSGIVSTNPCIDITPARAPASMRIPERVSVPAFCSTIDLNLCSAAPEGMPSPSAPMSFAGSPCKGRTCPLSHSMGIVSAAPCNTPFGITSTSNGFADASARVSAGVSPSGFADASARVSTTPCGSPAHFSSSRRGFADASARICPTPCNTPTGIAGPCFSRADASLASLAHRGFADVTARISHNACNTPTRDFSTPHCGFADASARTPVREVPHGTAAPDAFTSALEPAAFSLCRPRALFQSGGPSTLLEQAELSLHSPVSTIDGCVGSPYLPDTMRSWFQASGLPSGPAALEAELRAAVPDAYED